MSINYIELLEAKRTELEEYQDEICKQKLTEVFNYWAVTFPEYDLEVKHGMGIYSFDTSMPLEVFIEDLLCGTRKMNLFWDDKYESLFLPLREYTELFDSVSVGPPPCPCDMKYCSVTKQITVV